MRMRAFVMATILSGIALVPSAPLSAQTASTPDWATLQAETLRHFQALLRLDTSNPPGNEYLVTDYVKSVLEKEGIPVALLGGMYLAKFRQIAEAHPRLKLIIDHCGLKSGAKDAAALEHLDEVVALARLTNVALKATGAPGYSTEPYPFRNLHDPLHRLFDAFGPDRFFWGTDITRMPCTYRQCVTFFTEELPWLKGQDLETVMGRGLTRWIGWDYKFDRGMA